jgi:putative MFS transporter
VAAAQPLIPMAYAAYSFDGVFWIFSFLCFVPAVVIAIWGQRTGGKSLEEIA